MICKCDCLKHRDHRRLSNVDGLVIKQLSYDWEEGLIALAKIQGFSHWIWSQQSKHEVSVYTDLSLNRWKVFPHLLRETFKERIWWRFDRVGFSRSTQICQFFCFSFRYTPYLNESQIFCNEISLWCGTICAWSYLLDGPIEWKVWVPRVSISLTLYPYLVWVNSSPRNGNDVKNVFLACSSTFHYGEEIAFHHTGIRIYVRWHKEAKETRVVHLNMILMLILFTFISLT